MQQNFGKAGQYYFNIARGIDNRAVNIHRPNKSVGVETTFQQDIGNPQDILEQLQCLLEKALHKTIAKKLTARTLTIKIKYQNFQQITRSRTLAAPITPNTPLNGLFEELLKSTDIGSRKVRLLGVTLSSLEKQTEREHHQQLDLFSMDP